MKLQFRHFALIGVCATALLSIPRAVYDHLQSAPQVRESPYLTAPGNRTSCDRAGWIGKQADSSRNPWKVSCTKRGVKI